MKLEKIIIDGQVYYKEVPTQDAEGSDMHTDCSQGSSDCHGDNLGLLADKVHAFGARVVRGTVAFACGLHEKAKKHFFKAQFRKESTSKRLLCLLPYMDDAGRHDVFLRFCSSLAELSEDELILALPFFCPADRDSLFLRYIEERRPRHIEEIAALVSKDALSRVVDGYIDGRYSDMDIEGISSLLALEDIKRLYEFYSKK